jgi:hypothetical protein
VSWVDTGLVRAEIAGDWVVSLMPADQSPANKLVEFGSREGPNGPVLLIR